MSLATQVSDLATRIGTEIKTVRTEIASGLSGKQASDGDLTTIAGIDSTTAGALVTDGAGWIRKTYAQLKTALSLVKADVGLGNVDNTSDANKPVSTATQTALDLKQNSLGFTAENAANKGAAGGYAPLDGSSKISSTYLPAYVDDVVEVANFAALPGTGVAGIIYVTLDDNHFYRWGGSAYVDMTTTGGPSDTDDLPEGSTNLYYTDARVNTLLDAQMGDEATDFVDVFETALV